LLARREYGRSELTQRLWIKGFVGPKVDEVLDRLAQSGQQSERRFAESLTRRRVEQGYGLLRIVLELRQAGIGEIDLSQYDWDAVLERIHRKRFGLAGPISPRDRAARHRYLLQRGFTSEQIQRLLRRLDVPESDSD
jgi:regulatory protein